MMIDKKALLLESKYINLRPVCVEDISDEYINGLNGPDVNRYLVHVRFKNQTYTSVEKYVQFNIEHPQTILFGIFLKDNINSLIGTVHVSGLDFFHFTSSIGICLFSKNFWGKGYARQSLKIVKDYLFGPLGLHYVEGGVYAENERSIKLFTSAGFTEMYRVNNKYRYDNSFKEVIFFGIVNRSFDKLLLESLS